MVVYCHRVENMYDLRDGYDYIFFLSETERKTMREGGDVLSK